MSNFYIRPNGNLIPIASITIVTVAGLVTWNYAHPENLLQIMEFLISWLLAIFILKYIFTVVVKSLILIKNPVSIEPNLAVVKQSRFYNIIFSVFIVVISIGVMSGFSWNYISEKHDQKKEDFIRYNVQIPKGDFSTSFSYDDSYTSNEIIEFIIITFALAIPTSILLIFGYNTLSKYNIRIKNNNT